VRIGWSSDMRLFFQSQQGLSRCFSSSFLAETAADRGI
jgi:hypothetical protein